MQPGPIQGATSTIGTAGAPSGPDARLELSVVVPIYRNASTLVELLDRIEAALAAERFETVLVVDGSPDESLAILTDEATRRPTLRVVELSRNFGQHAALCAGFEEARGDCVLLLDGDLQQDPADLTRFVEAWRAGSDFVSGWRVKRKDPLDRRLGSLVLNRLVRGITGVTLHDWGCPLAAIDRSVIDRVPAAGEQRRFLKPLVAKLSRNPVEVEVQGHERDGRSSYSTLALLGVTLDFAVSFTNRPFLKLIGVGFLGGVLGVAIGVAYILARLFGILENDDPRIQAVSFAMALFGLQFLIVGALGEFTHRIYRLVQGQPLFEVRHVHGREDGEAAGGGQ